jgi:murein DD-endopeptidase MepM/ murein hydrolase activator NlpD
MAGLPTGKANEGPPAQKLGMGGVSMDAPDPNRLSQLQIRANFLEQNFALLNQFFHGQQERLSVTPSILPTQGFISSFFGSRRNPFTGSPDFHEGLDITTEKGTAVMAPADGVVIFAGPRGNYGNVLEIRHSDELSTMFGHLDKILVKPGQRVRRWEKVALVGNTGRSTGPHLHYEVHVAQQPVNPLPYILNLESFS